MFNLRNETIKAILTELKIDNSPFNIEIVKEFIAHIADAELKAFYMALFKDGAKIFNGLDRVAKIAEAFKPTAKEDPIEKEAKELIQWCESANSTVFDSAKKSGLSFEDELKRTGFKRLLNNNNDLAVLNAVKPYCEYKRLIGNIRTYQDTKVQIQAFMEAIKFHRRYTANAIENKTVNKLRIKAT